MEETKTTTIADVLSGNAPVRVSIEISNRSLVLLGVVLAVVIIGGIMLWRVTKNL